MSKTDKLMQELNEGGLYGSDMGYVRSALEKGIAPEQIRKFWNDTDYLTFRCIVRALSKGLEMPVAEYFLGNKELSYDAKNELIDGLFKNQITLVQAEKYIAPEYTGAQVRGLCELFGAVPEDTAKQYATQPFRLRQLEWIAYGYKHGYPEELMDMYARPEITSTVMQTVCELADASIEPERISFVLVPGLDVRQRNIIKEAILDGVPANILKICARKNLLLENMHYIIYGYKNGLDELQLLRIADCKYRGRNLYEELIREKGNEPRRPKKPWDEEKHIEGMTYDSLLSAVRNMSSSFTGTQRKELVDAVLYGDI